MFWNVHDARIFYINAEWNCDWYGYKSKACETNRIFLIIGNVGVYVASVTNISLGALFYNQQQKFDTSRDLTLLW